MTRLHRRPPPATYPFAYRTPPKRSGNEINGLGVRKQFRPEQVFHNTGRGEGREPIDWAAMDTFFAMTNPFTLLLEQLRARWERRRAAGPVADRRLEVTDKMAMADAIKQKGKALGIDLVGIARYDDTFQVRDISFPYTYAVCLGAQMNRDEMLHVPYVRGEKEVLRTYRKLSRMTNQLAAHIRSFGWPAEAYGVGEDIMQIPLAIQAGLGQLGKHGSMINRELGSNFRLACILTDLPMAVDEPVDIGVDDLCVSCQRCVQDCPPDAIFNEKQWVRGINKWYVDFDKCVPYFAHTHGCAICLEVCPWSEPGRGPILSEKILAKRPSNGERAQPAG